MRISDWSSDVCSSDLRLDQRPDDTPRDQSDRYAQADQRREFRAIQHEVRDENLRPDEHQHQRQRIFEVMEAMQHRRQREIERAEAKDRHDIRRVDEEEIGRASCRERVWTNVYITVVAVTLKK